MWKGDKRKRFFSNDHNLFFIRYQDAIFEIRSIGGLTRCSVDLQTWIYWYHCWKTNCLPGILLILKTILIVFDFLGHSVTFSFNRDYFAAWRNGDVQWLSSKSDVTLERRCRSERHRIFMWGLFSYVRLTDNIADPCGIFKENNVFKRAGKLTCQEAGLRIPMCKCCAKTNEW